MHWLIFLIVFFCHNEFASSWHSPQAEVSCETNLQCLLLSSNTASNKKRQEIVPSSEINTWYPIPKWKVFFGTNKNRKEYSAPYFNKQDSWLADANVYDNDFSQTQFLKKPFEISERLNIQFFPVKDGNITVKKFERKINDNAAEQVALFVIYAHSGRKGIARTQNNSDGIAVSEELVSELMKENDNISITCDGSGVCMENITFVDMEKFLNTNKEGNETFGQSFEVVSIPVTKSMSIEMNIGDLGENNYTAVIVPINGNFTSKGKKYEESVRTNKSVIKIPLDKNMKIIINSINYSNFTKSFRNKTANESELVEELTSEAESTEYNLLENTYQNGTEAFGRDNIYSTENISEAFEYRYQNSTEEFGRDNTYSTENFSDAFEIRYQNGTEEFGSDSTYSTENFSDAFEIRYQNGTEEFGRDNTYSTENFSDAFEITYQNGTEAFGRNNAYSTENMPDAFENRYQNGTEAFDRDNAYFTVNITEGNIYIMDSYPKILLENDTNFDDSNSITNESMRGNLKDMKKDIDLKLENSPFLEYGTSFGTQNVSEKHSENEKVTEYSQKVSHSIIPDSPSNPYIYEYSKKLGPYEIKELNSTLLPFIATIHLKVKNKVRNNDTNYRNSLEGQSISYRFENNFPSKTLADMDKNHSSSFVRKTRYVENNENSRWKKLFAGNAKDKITKEEITNSKGIFNQNDVSNNYQKGLARFILNKAEDKSPHLRRMNYNFSILEARNAKEEQREHSYSLREESYSSATISNSNEEFNPKSKNKFRNKILIANEISDNTLGADGVKSNQTASGDRNKREVAFVTLIPNKDSGENHSKKSELQIVERASLDKYSDLWKMKIPQEEQRLGRNSIKTGKICDLEDGCSGINDVFNAMKVTESGYYKGYHAGEVDFDRNESSKVSKVIDKRIDFRSRDLMRKMSESVFTPQIIHRLNINDLYAKEKYSLKREPKHFDFENKKLPTQSVTKNIHAKTGDRGIIMNMNRGTGNDFGIKKEENEEVNTIRSLQTDSKSKTEYANFLWKEFEIGQNTKKLRGEKPEFQEIHRNDLYKPSFTSRNLIRRKRSNFRTPLASYNRHQLYPTHVNGPINEIPLQTADIPNFASRHSSGIRSDELEWQKFLFRMMQMDVLNSRKGIRNIKPAEEQPQNRIKEWLKRGSSWTQEKHPIFQTNDHIFGNREKSGYDWFIIIPEKEESFTQLPMRGKLPRAPVQDKKMVNDTMRKHTEREREDDETAQWVTVSQTPPSKEQNKGKQNTTPSPMKEMNPRPIVNTPARKPNFLPTRRPWSPDQHWNWNQWTISHNRWNPVHTTPMMMMGGMAGGD